MASFNFNKTIHYIVDQFFGSGSFKMALVTALPDEADKDAWDFYNDVTDEVANGDGYTTGGAAVTLTVAAVDGTNNDVEVTCSAPTWPASSISAVAGVVYKDTGNSATSRVIGVIDFGETVTSTNGTFTATPSGSIKFQN